MHFLTVFKNQFLRIFFQFINCLLENRLKTTTTTKIDVIANQSF
jgi:hypothetical protein